MAASCIHEAGLLVQTFWLQPPVSTNGFSLEARPLASSSWPLAQLGKFLNKLGFSSFGFFLCFRKSSASPCVGVQSILLLQLVDAHIFSFSLFADVGINSCSRTITFIRFTSFCFADVASAATRSCSRAFAPLPQSL